MEIIAEFLSFFIQLVFWIFVISFIKGFAEKLIEARDEEIKDIKSQLVKMIHFVKQEKHGDLLYWFDHETDAFLGQGASVEEITEHVKKRFPTHIFVTEDADKFMKAPDWTMRPINELEGMKNVKQSN